MVQIQTLSFYEKFFSLKRAKERLYRKKQDYTNFVNEIYSLSEAEEKIISLEKNIENLKHRIDLNNLFVIDISCLVFFAMVGLQIAFKQYIGFYQITSIILCMLLAIGIFVNIYRNKIKFCYDQYNLIKSSWIELINPNKYFDRLGVETLLVTLGNDLKTIYDEEHGGILLQRLVMLRKQLVDELGYIIPNVRILFSAENEPKEYDIWVRGKLVAKGEVVDKPEFLDEADVIAEHLKKVAVEYVNYIFTLNNVYKISELVSKKDNALITTMSEYIDSLDIRNILVKLLEKKISIKDIELIYQKIADYGRDAESIEDLTEKIISDMKKINKIGKDLV